MEEYKHYVPVLRWKPAEQKALITLSPKYKELITPLIEILPSDNNSDFITKELLSAWDNKPIFIDVSLIDTPKQKNTLLGIYQANQWGLAIVPVISLIDEPNILSIVKSDGNPKEGICLRITENDLINDNFSVNIEDFVNKSGFTENQIDLVVDLKIRNSDNLSVAQIIARIHNISKWRSFVLLSGYFPESLIKFSNEKSRHIHPRKDWQAWKEQINMQGVVRKPSYGDYTIQYPLYQNIENLRGSCSIKYTTEDYWLIMRGKKPKPENGGFKQYLANANLLINEQDFCGSAYSFGDDFIFDKGNNYLTALTGNAGDWLFAGINHHLTFVANQISKIS